MDNNLPTFGSALLTFTAGTPDQFTPTEQPKIIQENHRPTWKQQFENNQKDFVQVRIANERKRKRQQQKRMDKQRKPTGLETILEEEKDDNTTIQETTRLMQPAKTQREDTSKDISKMKTTQTPTLRQILQQNQGNTQLNEENKVTHHTSAQFTTTRSQDIARSTGAISSAKIFKTDGAPTSTLNDKVESTLFGPQVSNPIAERSPTETQAGRATPPKHIKANTGFAGRGQDDSTFEELLFLQIPSVLPGGCGDIRCQ